MDGIILLALLIGVPLGLAFIGIKLLYSPARQLKGDADRLEVEMLRGRREGQAFNEVKRRYGM